MLKQKPILNRGPVRVARDEVRRDDPFAPQDGLNYCLECWRHWMHTDDRDLSVGTMRIDYIQEGPRRASPAEIEEARLADERRRDMKIGEATGAMIDSLKPIHQWAIYKSVGLSRVYRFDSADYFDHLLLAKLELIEKLKKNVATRFQFE
jgi:hypothetical protein